MNQDAVMPNTKVLLVDDDEAFRRSTARILAAHGYACVERATSDQARIVLDTEPDVAALLCDIRMPGKSGIELLRELTVDFPDLAIVMTTGIDDPQIAEVTFELGAFGYIVKPFDANELLISLASALRRRDLESSRRGHVRALESIVAAHEVPRRADVASLLRRLPPTSRGLGADITPRELEVLGLVAAGLGNKQIAERLVLSLNTVRNHTQSILQKLQAHSKLEAVATAVREGIIDYPAVTAD